MDIIIYRRDISGSFKLTNDWVDPVDWFASSREPTITFLGSRERTMEDIAPNATLESAAREPQSPQIPATGSLSIASNTDYHASH